MTNSEHETFISIQLSPTARYIITVFYGIEDAASLKAQSVFGRKFFEKKIG